MRFVIATLLMLRLIEQTASAENLVKDLRLGGDHACALLEDDTLKCWGDNGDGQLGIGDVRPRGKAATDMGDSLPRVKLGTNRTVKSFATGSSHSCAVLDNNKLKCWGNNDFNQLGYGDSVSRGGSSNTVGDSLAYVNLGTGRTALQVAAGFFHTCVLLDNKRVKCWGYNAFGQLGLGVSTSPFGRSSNEIGDKLPTVNLGTDRIPAKIFAAGYMSCVQFEDSAVKCWGSNSSGRLGLGDSAPTKGTLVNEMGDGLSAIDVGNSRTITSFIPAYFGSCAILSDGTPTCWGGNSQGELCNASTVPKGSSPSDMGMNLAPIAVGSALRVMDLSCGSSSCCVILSNNGVKCWGSNRGGALGRLDSSPLCTDPSSSSDAMPFVNLGYLQKPFRVFAGDDTSCVLFANKKLKCWGENGVGQTGLGQASSTVPSLTQPMGDSLNFINL